MKLEIEAGDLPGWIGAITGLGALAWNGVRAWRAARMQNQRLIVASITRGGTGDLVTVDFTGAERHTAYRLLVSCRRPRKLQVALVPQERAERWYGAATPQTQPALLPMRRVGPSGDIAQVQFTAQGGATSKALRLTLTVQEANGRVRAKRKLSMFPD